MGTRTGNPTWANAPATSSPISAAALEAIETVLDASAPNASPTFTGTPVVPTAAVNTNTTQAASTAYVRAQIASEAVTKGLVDAKGDIFAGTANDTVARLGVGTDGQVLTADSTQATGLRWTTVSGGAADATTTTKGIVQLAGDLAGTAAAPTVVAATTSVAGKVELATLAETLAGTDGTRAVPPSGVQGIRGLYVAVNAQTGTTYTPVLADQGKLVTLSNASPVTVSLPQDSDVAFPIGASIDFVVIGSGSASFVAGTGATVNTSNSVAGTWVIVQATKRAANTWVVYGRLPAASETVAGIANVATQAEVTTGTNDAKFITPLKFATAMDSMRGVYVGVNAQTGTTYTPVLTDQGKFVTLTNAAAITVTMPSDASVAIPIGGTIDFQVRSTGMATFVAGSGATVDGTPSLVTRANKSAVTAIKVAANTWTLVGDLA